MSSKRFSLGLTALLALFAATMLATGLRAAAANNGGASGVSSPTAYFHPSVLDFTIGKTSTQTTTLTNTSSQSLLIRSFDLVGGRANTFTMSTTCGFSLAAGSSCTVTLTVFAAAGGPLGQLVEYDNSGVGHHQVLLQAR